MGSFGELIKELRKHRRWSHDRLAREAKLTKQALINIEKLEEPRVREVSFNKLAAAFGTDEAGLRRLYEERRKLAGAKLIISAWDDEGNTVYVPRDVVMELVKQAEAAGKNPTDYLFEMLTKAFKTSPPRQIRKPVVGGVQRGSGTHYPVEPGT